VEHPGEIEDDIPKWLVHEERECEVWCYCFLNLFNTKFLQLFLDKLVLERFPGRLKCRSEKERTIDTQQQLTFAGKTSTVSGMLVLKLSSGCITAEITSGVKAMAEEEQGAEVLVYAQNGSVLGVELSLSGGL
jgi:hypothetical protein